MDKREESEGITAEMEENTLPGATCKSLLPCILFWKKKKPAPSMLRHACAPEMTLNVCALTLELRMARLGVAM